MAQQSQKGTLVKTADLHQETRRSFRSCTHVILFIQMVFLLLRDWWADDGSSHDSFSALVFWGSDYGKVGDGTSCGTHPKTATWHFFFAWEFLLSKLRSMFLLVMPWTLILLAISLTYWTTLLLWLVHVSFNGKKSVCNIPLPSPKSKLDFTNWCGKFGWPQLQELVKHLTSAKNSVKLLLRMLGGSLRWWNLGQKLWKKVFIRPIERKIH